MLRETRVRRAWLCAACGQANCTNLLTAGIGAEVEPVLVVLALLHRLLHPPSLQPPRAILRALGRGRVSHGTV